MTRSARGVYGLLVVATVAAFFVTQRLKHGPTVVQRFMATPRFAPGAARGLRRERLSFRIARSDDVTVAVLDARGTPVRTLLSSHPLQRYTQLRLHWDGRNDGGVGVPAGTYRIRIGLRAQRRVVLEGRSITLLGAPAPTVARPEGALGAVPPIGGSGG